MTLLITAGTALIATLLVFIRPAWTRRARLGTLALMLWGATLMWCVDGFAALSAGESFIDLSPTTMADDAKLGAAVVALALIVWFFLLLAARYRRQKVTTGPA